MAVTTPWPTFGPRYKAAMDGIAVDVAEFLDELTLAHTLKS